MQKKIAPYALIALLVASALVAAAPSVAAQSAPTNAPSTVTIKITPYNDPIKPLSGVAILSAEVGYSYFAAGSTALTSSQVNLKVAEAPAWATVAISPPTLLFPIAASGTPGQQVNLPPQKVSIIVATTADAPAFTPANIKIQVDAQPNAPIGPSSSADTTLITADYFSIIDAQVTQPIRVVRPQTVVSFPVTISNFGNANTKVTFAEATQPTAGLQYQLPTPAQLQAQQAGGTQIKQTVDFSVQTPFKNGYMNQPGVINMMLKATYALDSTKKGDEIPVSILVTTKGFYVPGLGPLAFLAAIGIAAAVVGVRRRDA